jgi:methionyl-tRNA synthetase
MESFQIDKALKNIFDYLSEVNAYVDEQAPWALKKTDTTRMQDVLYVITLITIKCSVLLQPIIPYSIYKVLNIYNVSLKEFELVKLNDFNPNTIKLNIPKPIFPRIEK